MRRIKEQVKAHHVESTSGDSPQSHPGLAEAASPKKEPLELTEVFVCIGGVNLTTLLRATRGALMETAEALGANALVEEQCVFSRLHVALSQPLFLGGNALYAHQSSEPMGLTECKSVTPPLPYRRS